MESEHDLGCFSGISIADQTPVCSPSSPSSCRQSESLGSRGRHSQAPPDPPCRSLGLRPHEEARGLPLVRPADQFLGPMPFSCRTSQGLDYVNVHHDSLRQGVGA